jgi:hypothetical protein
MGSYAGKLPRWAIKLLLPQLWQGFLRITHRHFRRDQSLHASLAAYRLKAARPWR